MTRDWVYGIQIGLKPELEYAAENLFGYKTLTFNKKLSDVVNILREFIGEDNRPVTEAEFRSFERGWYEPVYMKYHTLHELAMGGGHSRTEIFASRNSCSI